MSKKRKRHSAEEVVKKLRDADAMLAAGKDLAAVLQALEVSEPRCPAGATSMAG
jgi:putative transposase